MNLKFAQDRYSYYSGKLSDIVRQLGFAGIALVWLFRSEVAGQWYVSAPLVLVATVLVAALALDFLQYVSGALAWGIFHRQKEKAKTKHDEEFEAPRWINWPAICFFWAKVSAIAIAYALMFRFLALKVSVPN